MIRRQGAAIVFLRPTPNKFSVNALLGALQWGESHKPPVFPLADVHVLSERDHAASIVASLCRTHERALLAMTFFTAQFPAAARTLEWIRAACGDNLTAIAGGCHASGDPASVLDAGFDAVCVGEGELTMLEVAAAFRAGRPLTGIPGLATRGAGGADGGMALERRREAVDLAELPPFPLGCWRAGPIEITRGCAHGCKYCQTPRLFGRAVRHRPPEMVAAAAADMARRGLRDVRFTTPDAFAYGASGKESSDPAVIEDLLRRVGEAMRAEGVQERVYFGSFPSEVRPERVTPKLLALVRKYAANDNVVMGAQSGSETVLERCGRGCPPEAVRAATRYVLEAGLTPVVDFIFGLPGEGPEEAGQTMAMIRELTGWGARVRAHAFMPLPGSAFEREPPGAIPEAFRQELRVMESTGRLFGCWKQQEKLARRPRGAGESGLAGRDRVSAFCEFTREEPR